MDFDYWDQIDSPPRTSFTVYASGHRSASITSMGRQNVRNVRRVLLDDQEELESVRAIRRRLLPALHGQSDSPSHQIHQMPRERVSHQPVKYIRMSSAGPTAPISSSYSSPYHIRDSCSSSISIRPSSLASASTTQCNSPSAAGGEALCAVCGDGHAKLHYGVLACYGCKGFFRRTLTGKYRYVCRFGNNCVVDKFQRNSCRCCRFNRCLEVGMDPNAVKPDRDLTGKQKVPRTRKRAMDEELINHMMRLQGDDWSRKIPVEAKMLLMQLLNIESKVAKGDSSLQGFGSIPSPSTSGSKIAAAGGRSISDTKNVSLKELFEQKPSNTKRTEMCYEPCIMAKAEELPKIAHRGAIAAVDWVESLLEMIEAVVDTEDKIALVKACYAPLTIFNFSARTVQNTRNPDILCLCSYSFVPRKLPPDFNGSNHLSNNLIDRTLNELVAPLRRLNLREEEVISLKAIIILDPNAKNISAEAQRGVAELRDKVQDMLFQIVKELHPAHNAASRFGNLLLLLPTITTLSGVMCENIQFCQVFGFTDPLLNELFDGDSKMDEPPLSAALFGCSSSAVDPSAGGGLSYSPPMLGGDSLCNPAEISLHLHTNSGDQSPAGFQPPTMFSSHTSCSCSSSSSSPTPSKTTTLFSPEKCEISTQTDEPIESPANLIGREFDYHYGQKKLLHFTVESENSNFRHQQDRNETSFYEQQQQQQDVCSNLSPLYHLLDDQLHSESAMLMSGNVHQQRDDPIDFSTAESLLFDGTSSADDDLFGLMQ